MDSPTATKVQASLGVMADALIGVESSRALLVQVEDLLAGVRALPARLFLFDGDAQVFYGAAGFGCGREAPDIFLAQIVDQPPVCWHPLHSQGN